MFFLKPLCPLELAVGKKRKLRFFQPERICLFDQDVKFNSLGSTAIHDTIQSPAGEWPPRHCGSPRHRFTPTLSKEGEDVRWNVFGCSILMNMKRFIESNKFQIYIALYIYIYVIVKYADDINLRHVWCEHSIPVKISLCMYIFAKVTTQPQWVSQATSCQCLWKNIGQSHGFFADALVVV